MTKASQRIFSVEFKLEAVRRMEAGVNVSGLAQELCVLRKDLYRWRAQVRAGAPMLGKPGRPAGAASVVSDGGGATSNEDELAQARSRIAELERKVGQLAAAWWVGRWRPICRRVSPRRR